MTSEEKQELAEFQKIQKFFSADIHVFDVHKSKYRTTQK